MYERNDRAVSEAIQCKSFDLTEELFLDLDPSHDAPGVWEWNGQAWIAIAD